MYLELFPDLKAVKVKYLKYISEEDKIDVMFLLKNERKYSGDSSG